MWRLNAVFFHLEQKHYKWGERAGKPVHDMQITNLLNTFYNQTEKKKTMNSTEFVEIAICLTVMVTFTTI